ncbi:LysM peptidoglycan-binding domain-containing protein [Hyphomicrobium sp. NDB2Meth4]|uniref:LysM peptidoglycan-binding domain-containing protein n=1 Tax=Hyphomicrobium sp. NDB2Meth4 TaxID=1892846 RepID=UPI000930D658|nr:LysM peptidoglycan-binding domain-containing protein [Hyphomicrobium sp. NDB2Meth4]
MMRFKRFLRETSLLQPAARAATIIVAAMSGGCTASVSGFDFPSFSLNDDKPAQQTASGYGRSNLGNDSYGSGGAPYSAPRSNRESSVASQDLPDASPSAYSGGRTGTKYASNNSRYDQTSYSGQSNYGSSGDSSSKYNSYTANGRYGTVAPSSTASTNRYDPQPTPSLANPGDTVEVQSGDTLYGISRRHNVSVAELMQLNNMTSPNIKLGQKLYLPQGVSARHSPAPVTQTASIQPPPPPSPPSSHAGNYGGGTYTVRPGDSIYGISRSLGVSAAELQQANGITDVRSVKAGTVLRVPGAGSSSGGYDTAQQPVQHVAVTPPPASQSRADYQNAGPSTAQQPTMLNGAQPSTNYTQVATRNVNTNVAPPRQSVASNDKLRWPVSGRIISGFGQRSDGTHNDGINMSVPMGTSVHAAEGGTVAYAGSELKGYGNLILLRHDNGWVTAYAHNDQLMVKRGDKVQRGQVIATAGRTGSVDQPQVHFELRQGSKPVDPVPFLEKL